MSKVRDTLRPLWLQGLHEVSVPTRQSLKEWIVSEQYVISTLDAGTGEIEIFSSDTNAIVSAVAFDIDRFGAAVVETVAGVGTTNEVAQSRAWPLIRSYYAAFFAAHALSRIFGRSITKLDRDEGDALRRVATSSGLGAEAQAIQDTLYAFDIDVPGRLIAGTRLGRGPHEEAWGQFEKLLSDLQTRLLQIPTGITADKQQVFDFLQVIRDILNNDRSRGNWLSKIRNNLNYRHDYGAWFPHGTGRHWSDVDGIFRAFLNDPLTWHLAPETKIIVRFAKGCALIVALFMEVARDLAARHPRNKPFLSERTLALINRMPLAQPPA